MDAITVAAINSFAFGGSCELSSACNFRLMSDSVRGYGIPETSIGLIPGAGGWQRMSRLLDTAKAAIHGGAALPMGPSWPGSSAASDAP